MRHFPHIAMTGLIAAVASSPVLAQEEQERTTVVQPYIEVNQVLSAELTPGDEVVTFTQIATGVDVNTQGRNSGASVSVRYERNIGYGDDVDSNTLSGIARGSLSMGRGATFEAGGLASRTRVDDGAGISNNPLVAEDAESRLYSVYAGPTVNTQVGAVGISGTARVGYNRFETDNAVLDQNGDPVDVFDDSVSYVGQVRAGTRAGDVLPVGISATVGAYQEDISNLDQRVRDVYARADVTIPLTDNFAVVGGVGYEDVEVSSRDVLRDVNGDPVLDNTGRFVTDEAGPRQIAFDVDGIIWDVGVTWNPSSRTSLSAAVGRRYDSTTYYGSFAYAPNDRSALNISVYDGLTSFGGALNTSLAGLSSDFEAFRNPLTGDFTGITTGQDGAGIAGNVGSIRSAAFRNQGVSVGYQRRIGRTTAAIGAGYDRREYIAAEGTILEAIDGIADESYYVAGALSREVGRNGSLAANAYVNWFDSGIEGGNLTSYGASAQYNRAITNKISARAALGVDYIESEFTDEDFAAASALLGLRYNF